MSLFRTASAQDYSFNPESGFWELSFDTRPVRGTRCDDPEHGAIEYNQGQERDLFNVQLGDGLGPDNVYEFTELVKWVIESGDLPQRQIVLAMLQAESIEQYWDFAHKALQIIPSHFEFAFFWADENAQRFRVSVELRQELIDAIGDDK